MALVCLPLWGVHVVTPREEVTVAEKKTEDPEVRLKMATAALVLLEVLAKLVETVVQMAHHI
jgi:hypothetical protein